MRARAAEGNIIVLAFRRRPLQSALGGLCASAHGCRNHASELEFLRFVEVMKRLNPHTEKRLLI